jgi:uncharacterized protein with GYD domain
MKFVTLFRFTSQGIANVMQTTKRAKDFVDRLDKSGFKVHQLLWTQGHHDGVVIYDAPDHEAAAAAMLKVASAGNVQTETMVAFDFESMERVLAKAK